MVLTSSYQRRTAGFTALFAAVLLILTAVLIASPAAADSHTGTCKHVAGYDEAGNIVGNSGGDWGSITHTADGPLTLNVNDGYTLHLCLKKGSAASDAGAVDTGPYVGPIVNQEVRYSDGHGLSHYSYRVVGTPTEVTPDEPGFTDPDCDTAAAVVLPGTTGVDYSYDSEDVVPGGTVTVTATPQAGYFFPEGATTVWEYPFPTVSEDCDPPVAVTAAEPTFTDPTCDANQIGLTVPDTTGVVYTVTGDQEPGGTVMVTAAAAEGYKLAEDADDEWSHTFGALATDCEEPGPSTGVDPDEVVKTPAPDVVKTPAPDVVEVSPNVVEKPAPDPAPAEQPAVQAAAAQELPATGLGSTELLLLALMMMGLGAAALLGSDPRRQN